MIWRLMVRPNLVESPLGVENFEFPRVFDFQLMVRKLESKSVDVVFNRSLESLRALSNLLLASISSR